MRGRTTGIALGCVAALAIAGVLAMRPAIVASPAAVAPVASRADRAVSSTAATATAAAGRAAATRRTTPTDTGCVIVRLKAGITTKQLAAIGATGARKLGGTGLVTIAAPRGSSATQFADRLERSELVDYAEPDYLLKTATDYTATPNDPDFNDPYAYLLYGFPSIPHARSWPLRDTGSANFDQVWPALASANATAGQVHVAVMDTGYYFSHPDASGSNIRAAIDECATYDPLTSVLTTDANCEPVPHGTPGVVAEDISHGTMTASEIGAGANNGIGGVGAAYDTQVDIYKVMGVSAKTVTLPDGSRIYAGDAVMPVSGLVNAIHDATDASIARGYRLVISISLELIGPQPTEVRALADAVSYAKSHNAVVVAASGNGDSSGAANATVSYPAAVPGVIAVGAYTVATGAPAWAAYSNYGSALFMLAPGGGSVTPGSSRVAYVWGPTDPASLSLSPGELNPRYGYDWWEGTSMATPYVASAAALLLRVQPDLTNAEVASYLASGTVDMATPGWDAKTGWGRLDAYRSFYLLARPHTTADVRPRYASSATIAFSVSSRRGGTTFTTRYTLDDTHTVLTGTQAVTTAMGPHTLTYWSVDSDGIVEEAHTATFAVLPPDTVPPETVSNAVATYSGTASITLSATDPGVDAWGVAQTLYRLDAGATAAGTAVTTGRYGSHTLTYWSTDLAGNVEPANSAVFWVRQAVPTLTLARSASTVRRNQSVKLSGYLTPSRAGDYVRIQVRYPGSSRWVNFTSAYQRRISTVSSTGRGAWSGMLAKLTKRGRYYFRAYFPTDLTYISRYARYSSTVSVYVR